MRGYRPTVVLTLGIIDIVFGTLALLCGSCAAVQPLMLQGLSQMTNVPGARANPMTNMLEFLNRECPGYVVVETGRGVMVVVLGVALVAAGIGLLSMHGWARWLALACAVFAVPLYVGFFAYEVGLAQPAQLRWQEEFYRQNKLPMPAGYSQMQQAPVAIQAAGVMLLGLIHSAANLIILLLPGVRAAFAGMGPPVEDDDPGPRRRRPRRPRSRDDDEDDDA
jgi:hypothetical protein